MTTISDSIATRESISESDKWNVSALYQSFDAWESDFKEACRQQEAPRWPELQPFRGHLHEGDRIVKELFETTFAISRKLEKLYTYAHLRHDEEITIDLNKAAYQRIASLMIDFQQESAWIDSEILELPEPVLESYLNSSLLKTYQVHLEKIIRLRPHTLTSEKEELLAMAGKPMQMLPRAFSALNNADIKFGKIDDSTGKEYELTHGLYQLYLRSTDRKLRANAFQVMHEKYFDVENTLSELLHGEIQNHIFNAQARHFSSSLEAALFPKNIPQTVYHSLIQAVRSGLPALHRYIAIRKKILKLDQLHLYDLYVPLVEQLEMKMDYSEAEEAVIESTALLGEEYQSVLSRGLKKEGWVDRYENKNKRSGAYSSGCFDSYPYILMNYRESLRDVFTLAHEAGHSMHSYYSNRCQPYHYSHYPIFVAEVASTFNEELLMDHLLKRVEKKEERLFLINQKIEDIRATLFRQTMFAEFELKIHELAEKNQPLTPTLLKEIYLQLNQDYFGPATFIDREIVIEWARIPHFYYNFYVFQYATGISAALSLAEKILVRDEQARENYLSFLKGGSSAFPIELLKRAGVDMSTPAPVESALRKFNNLLDELEALT